MEILLINNFELAYLLMVTSGIVVGRWAITVKLPVKGLHEGVTVRLAKTSVVA